MSEGEKEKLVSAFIDGPSRVIVRYCRIPQTVDAIRREIGEYYKSVGVSVAPGELITRVARRLQDLENIGIMLYEDGKWATVTTASNFLEKYYGNE